MAFDPAADVATLLADFGVPVVFGASTTTGILDTRPVEELTDAGRVVLKHERILTVAAAWLDTLTGFGSNVTLTIDGREHRTGEPRRLDDEAIAEIPVTRR